MNRSGNDSTSQPQSDSPDSTTGATPVPWWRRGVVYQVYVRSYADSNGDGTGDINGLRSRLPYLAELGIDAIWVNPWYKSPLTDGGYDVADYREIEERYGHIDDAFAMIAEAHELGIKLITDLVPNHTSDQHAWFQEAISSPPGHPSRDRYHIRPGKGPDGSEPPTNWVSVFGGSAWKRLDDGEWFLHLFNEHQPDLDWTNPEVRAEFESILKFWLDNGADGFRVDVAHGLAKDPAFPDDEEVAVLLASATRPDHPFWDRDELHQIVRDWRAILDSYEGDRMMVAEAWVNSQDRLALYLRPDEYHQSFNFDFLQTEWRAPDIRAAIVDAVTNAAAVGSTPTWVLSNHDVVRHPTRLGLPLDTDWRSWLLDGPHDILDAELGARRARAAALLMLSLPGSTYIYQGEELGLPEVWDLPLDVLDDPVWEQSNHQSKGRDGCRVPIPWTRDGESFGFGDGPGWLPQPASFGELSAEAQAGDPASSLELHRAAIALRATHLVHDEELTMLDTDDHIVAFRRGSGVEVWVNLSGAPIELPAGDVLLRSVAGATGPLGVDEAAWVLPA